MSVTAVPLRPLKRGAVTKFWIALGLLALLAAAAAWFATGRFQTLTTPSGVRIQTLTPGTGEPVGINDGVMINYEGRLENGTSFDASPEGQPVPMLVQRVVPGFGEALRNMREGGSYRIWIPPELGFGATPPPGAPIPPNATLEFDVEVVEVARDVALQLQQMEQMQQLAPPEGGVLPPEAGQPQP